MRVAALDIGTNTLLMTIAECTGAEIHVLADEHRVARLGEGVDKSGIISHAAVDRAAAIIQDYRRISETFEVEQRCAVGTSVFRRASNGQDVAERLSAIWGAPIEILSGDEEARLSYCGTVEVGGTAAVLDIGGGSTELSIGQDGTLLYRTSLELGAVRCAERYWHSFPAPPSALAEAQQHIRALLATVEQPLPVNVVYAVAGTPTTLALLAQGICSFDWHRVHGFQLSRQVVASLWSVLSRSSLEQLRAMPGVHPQRADILPAGTLILLECMNVFGWEVVTVSARGLRYGIVRRACGLC